MKILLFIKFALLSFTMLYLTYKFQIKPSDIANYRIQIKSKISLRVQSHGINKYVPTLELGLKLQLKSERGKRFLNFVKSQSVQN